MKRTEIIMGMPITIEIVDDCKLDNIEALFTYFREVDARFSPYLPTSELSALNNGTDPAQLSDEMQEVLKLCQLTKDQTAGYFDISHQNTIDTSGLVKGWAIYNAAAMLREIGFKNFYIEAGGDVQTVGTNQQGSAFQVGIRNPFDIAAIVKVVALSGEAIATSGDYIRGAHIYNPHSARPKSAELKSLSVIGASVYDADRYATAAYAMGFKGLAFIEKLDGFEAYAIDATKTATFTSGFEAYVV